MSRLDELEKRVAHLEEMSGYGYVDVDPEKAAEAADLILDFIKWEESEEGSDYWEEIYEKLRYYAEEG